MDIRKLESQDWSAVLELLAASDLDPAGLDDHRETILVARDDTRLLGCAALEAYGPVGLVRSVAVAPEQRSNGLGSMLMEALLAFAEGQSIQQLYLLTTTAAPFFAKHGFATIERAAADPAIHASIQWQSVCPQSALLMRR